MTNAYTMRNLMELGNYNTSITREAFEANFTKTKESVRFTLTAGTRATTARAAARR